MLKQQMIHCRWSLYLANFANTYINACGAVESLLAQSEKQGFRNCFGLFAVTTADKKVAWITNWISNNLNGVQIYYFQVPMLELLKCHNLQMSYDKATHVYKCDYCLFIN
jgi:hypothetical protein